MEVFMHDERPQVLESFELHFLTPEVQWEEENVSKKDSELLTSMLKESLGDLVQAVDERSSFGLGAEGPSIKVILDVASEIKEYGGLAMGMVAVGLKIKNIIVQWGQRANGQVRISEEIANAMALAEVTGGNVKDLNYKVLHAHQVGRTGAVSAYISTILHTDGAGANDTLHVVVVDDKGGIGGVVAHQVPYLSMFT